ncbi:hypothetical protein AAE478_002719 [Parahypoxylon ruwenzoriense]
MDLTKLQLNIRNIDIPALTSTTLTLLRQNRALASGTAAAAVLALGAVIPLLSRAASNYRAWYALGPNGLPLNIFGYLFQALASPIARTDTREPAPYDAGALARSPLYGALSQRSFLGSSLTQIPPRADPRPDVPSFVGPHRQTSQCASSGMRQAQDAFVQALTAANPGLLRVRPSNLEGPLFDGLWVAERFVPLRNEVKNLNGEFAHVHGEGSTHLVLSLADAAAAIEAGWAERHRMSGVGTLMPWGFVMIYAPRDEGELRVWREFVVSSARYMFAGEEEIVMP